MVVYINVRVRYHCYSNSSFKGILKNKNKKNVCNLWSGIYIFELSVIDSTFTERVSGVSLRARLDRLCRSVVKGNWSGSRPFLSSVSIAKWFRCTMHGKKHRCSRCWLTGNDATFSEASLLGKQNGGWSLGRSLFCFLPL